MVKSVFGDFDEETLSDSSFNLLAIGDLATSVGIDINTFPSIDLGDKPNSVGNELRTIGKPVTVARTKVTKSNSEKIIDNLKSQIETANERIDKLSERLVTENKSHTQAYDAMKTYVRDARKFVEKALKEAGKCCDDNKRAMAKQSAQKDVLDKLKEEKKKMSDSNKDLRREKDELKRDKKDLLSTVAAQTKTVQGFEKTIGSLSKTIETLEKQLEKKKGGSKDDDLEEYRAKQQAKLEVGFQSKYMDLQLKSMENQNKKDAKSARLFSGVGEGELE
jgi:chromosome segregation ATPase